MLELSTITIITGGLLLLIRAPLLLAPSKARRAVNGFPRNRTAAFILTAVDMVWVAYLVSETALVDKPFFPKWALFILAPTAFLLITVFVDELLAVRAMGGLLLLVAAPILQSARLNPSQWRLVMALLAYTWVVSGIVLVYSPYMFRLMARYWTSSNARCRAAGLIGVIVSLLLLYLGIVVY